MEDTGGYGRSTGRLRRRGSWTQRLLVSVCSLECNIVGIDTRNIFRVDVARLPNIASTQLLKIL